MQVNDRLYRSREDRMLAGVAGGLAEMWGADPSLVRIVWALLVPLTGGIALVVYIVMAIVVPEEEDVRGAMPFAPGPPPQGAAGEPVVPGGPEPAIPGWTSPYPAQATRYEARAARRAARRERRGTGAAPLLLGALLVLLGIWFLADEYLPNIDFEWFWPLVLVGLGVVVLVMAIDRGPKQTGTSSGGEGTTSSDEAPAP
jgi:phage shock protein PspC (stress-responsive transcriptional regulator)